MRKKSIGVEALAGGSAATTFKAGITPLRGVLSLR